MEFQMKEDEHRFDAVIQIFGGFVLEVSEHCP
jgi:hypothetical protein